MAAGHRWDLDLILLRDLGEGAGENLIFGHLLSSPGGRTFDENGSNR